MIASKHVVKENDGKWEVWLGEGLIERYETEVEAKVGAAHWDSCAHYFAIAMQGARDTIAKLQKDADLDIELACQYLQDAAWEVFKEVEESEKASHNG